MESEEWARGMKEKENPDSSRISNFRPTYRGRDEKYIGSSSLPQPSGPYNTILCVCLRVSERGKKCGWKCLRLPFLFLFSVYAIRSFADRLPIVRRGGAALNRTRHEDGHWRHPSEGEGGRPTLALRSRPNTHTHTKKESSTQKKRRSWLSVRDATCDITVVPIWQLLPALLLTIEDRLLADCSVVVSGG